jgi:hypothetical protein
LVFKNRDIICEQIGSILKCRNFLYDEVFLTFQDQMYGGRDELLADILSIVHVDNEQAKAEGAVAMMFWCLVPEILLQLAHKVSPF